MKYLGFGMCSKYYIYILVAFISEFIIEYLYGLNPSNYSNPLRLFSFYPKIYRHSLFKNMIQFIGILSGGIILYFLQKLYEQKKEGEISLSKYEKMKNKVFGIKYISKRIMLFTIGLLYSLYIILSEFLSSSLIGIHLWMFEIIYISILSNLILKININTHKKIAIIIMIGPLLIINLILFSLPRTYHNCNIEKCNETDNKNIFEIIKIKYGFYYFIPLIFIFSEIITLMKDYCWVKSKFLMDIKSIHPYNILIYTGTIGFILIIISLFISSSIHCNSFSEVINYKNTFKNNKKTYYNYSYYNMTNNEKINLSNQICSLKQYNNNTHILNIYYDHFSLFFSEYSNFENNSLLEIFIVIPLLFIMHMIKSYCYIMIIWHLDPNNILIIENLFYLIRGIARIIANKADEKYLTITHFVLNQIQEIIFIISNLIYIEIIELKFCNFDYDLRRNIGKRSIDEYLKSEENIDKLNETIYDENNSSLINLSQDFEE